MKLAENILRFEEHFQNARKLVDRGITDYLVYNTLAMECFQAVNALIEIGEYIVTKKRVKNFVEKARGWKSETIFNHSHTPQRHN